jgi:hypothetical protein
MSDPRIRRRPLARDLDAGVWIGKGYEVAQYQLHEAVFPGRSPVVVSRFVNRWKERGLIAVERWNRIGMNRLRLTSRGRDLILVSGSAKPEDLFVPKKPVAPKDLEHHLWINDLRVVFGRLDSPPVAILPAWAIERNLVLGPSVVPDLLIVRAPGAGSSGRVLAAEVDLGTEPLKSVFLPKLVRLGALLAESGGGSRSGIAVLTKGKRRQHAILGSACVTVPIAVNLLPPTSGPAGLGALETMFTPPVQSSEYTACRNS